MEQDNSTKKPICKLTGTNGNVFSVMSEVKKALNKAGMKEEAAEFVKKAFNAKSYEEVLCMACEYTDVRL